MMLAGAGRTNWMLGGGIAFAGHAAVVAGLLLIGTAPPKPIVEDPVVLLELPPQAAPAPAALNDRAMQSESGRISISSTAHSTF